MSYSLRHWSADDINIITDYWYSRTPEQMLQMSADISALPNKEEMHSMLLDQFKKDDGDRERSYIIWSHDDEDIGFCSVKNIKYAESGEMHLHMFKSAGKGMGGVFFSQSALMFYEKYKLNKIICAPSATNPAPNKMLQKVGYQLIEKRVERSSALSLECELAIYHVDKESSENYVKGKLLIIT